MSFQLIFMNVPSQQSDGQLRKDHNIKTQMTKDDKRDTY
jgi:hypothetical protein